MAQSASVADAPEERRFGEEVDQERMAAWLRPLGNPLRLRLLHYLTRPHYHEEVASHLGLSRNAAQSHLDKLVEIGVLDRRAGVRETGPVTEYVVNPQALFLIYTEFEKLGSLRAERDERGMLRTLPEPGRPAAVAAQAGPAFTVVGGLNRGQRFPLPQAPGREWVAGRDTQCDLVLAHDPYVSNRHAEVRLERGGYVLWDLRSTNGTEHNFASVPRGGSVALRHGDVVGVGKTLLVFWDATRA